MEISHFSTRRNWIGSLLRQRGRSENINLLEIVVNNLSIIFIRSRSLRFAFIWKWVSVKCAYDDGVFFFSQCAVPAVHSYYRWWRMKKNGNVCIKMRCKLRIARYIGVLVIIFKLYSNIYIGCHRIFDSSRGQPIIIMKMMCYCLHRHTHPPTQITHPHNEQL